MTHEQARSLLLDLAYGELAPEESRDVAHHAAACSACAAELESIARIRSLAANLDDGPGPSRDRGELVEAARRAVPERPRGRWFTRPRALSFAAAATVVAIAVGVTLQLSGPDPRTDREIADDGVPARGPSTAPPETAAPETARQAGRESPAEAAPTRHPPPPPPTTPGHLGATREVPRQRAADPAPAPAAQAGERGKGEDAADGAKASRRSVSRSAVEDVEGSPATDLREERHQLRCGGTLVERVALVTHGGRVVKISERRGEAVIEGWYDGAGRLRQTRMDATGPSMTPPASPLPPVAPTTEALKSCGW
jgi:hypothetical protein